VAPLKSVSDNPAWDAHFRQGDREVMESVYRTTFAVVRRAAGKVLREPADCDSIVQQVFADLVASRKMREGYAGGDLSAWLCAIARHRALDFARRERRLTDLDAAGEPAASADPLEDFRQDLTRFALTLEPDRRLVLELRYLAGLTQVEAASRLGMPRSTLEDWERDIKRRLAVYLVGSVGQGRRALAPGRGDKTKVVA
jgi:RNA polymerase sigma factor (sigma-70 family)